MRKLFLESVMYLRIPVVILMLASMMCASAVTLPDADTAVVSEAASGANSSLFNLDWTGTSAMRASNYPKALQELLMRAYCADTLYNDFKLAVIYYRLQNYSTSLSLFRSIVEREPLLAPVIYLFIAEVEVALGRTGNTLAAYRSVLRGSITPRYRHYIYEKLRTIIEADSTISIEQAPWLEDYYRWVAPQEEPTVYSRVDTINQIIEAGQWQVVDSIIRTEPFTGSDRCRLVGAVRAMLEDDVLSVPALFSCAQMAHGCGELTVAEQFVDHIKKRRRFTDSLPQKQYYYFVAQLLYDQQEWRDAIRAYKKYMKKFGKDSDALLSIARAYRKINKESESAAWYDRLMDAYPRHPKTQEILWLRAWQNEDRKRFGKAGEYYRRIYKKYRKGKRADESYLRHGLCYYRQKKYDSALVVLEYFTEHYPNSAFQLAGYYWQAKNYLAKDDKTDAIALLRLISRKAPFDYYAHRSRQVLLELGDTANVLIDTSQGKTGIDAWFDSATVSSQVKPLSAEDSLALLSGIYLASVGEVDKSYYFLEPIELGFPANLTLQYQLARFYGNVDASAQAFRIARRLSWRIPETYRSEMPLEVYKLFFPPFYYKIIRREAQQYKLDPFFVMGVIRQESIFNPKIVSPAGAVGLMQIMPYTGKYIAEKKKSEFSVDSLYLPEYNIRFGTYYLYELMDTFEGNTFLALAGYNAGPHNAKRWWKQNKHKEQDLFVEDIGYTETRGYVKKVMSNYWAYQYLATYPAFFANDNVVRNDAETAEASVFGQ
jgi:soluble lytic murein transglycosylase-like protein/TolA-binding protein